MHKEHIQELKDGIASMVKLLLGENGKADIKFGQTEDVLAVVIEPADVESLSLLISKNGIGIDSLRRLAVLGAKRRHLNVYISVKELTCNRGAEGEV